MKLTSSVESPQRKLKLLPTPLLIFPKNKLPANLAVKTEKVDQKEKEKLEEMIVKEENQEDLEKKVDKDLKEKRVKEDQEEKKEASEDLEKKEVREDPEKREATEDQEEKKEAKEDPEKREVREDNSEKVLEVKELNLKFNGLKLVLLSQEMIILICKSR